MRRAEGVWGERVNEVRFVNAACRRALCVMPVHLRLLEIDGVLRNVQKDLQLRCAAIGVAIGRLVGEVVQLEVEAQRSRHCGAVCGARIRD